MRWCILLLIPFLDYYSNQIKDRIIGSCAYWISLFNFAGICILQYNHSIALFQAVKWQVDLLIILFMKGYSMCRPDLLIGQYLFMTTKKPVCCTIARSPCRDHIEKRLHTISRSDCKQRSESLYVRDNMKALITVHLAIFIPEHRHYVQFCGIRRSEFGLLVALIHFCS